MERRHCSDKEISGKVLGKWQVGNAHEQACAKFRMQYLKESTVLKDANSLLERMPSATEVGAGVDSCCY
jgi:hypothetical protein